MIEISPTTGARSTPVCRFSLLSLALRQRLLDEPLASDLVELRQQ